MSCAFTRLVDAHFAQAISNADETRLREHLPGCAECVQRYERQDLLARALPDAPSAEARMGVALGFAPRRPKRPGRWWLAALAPLAAAVLLALWPRAPQDSGFTPRGADAGAVRWLEVYRLEAGAPPVAAPTHITARDALAFVYRNPEAHPYFMLFAVDSTQRVHWYYPEWTSAGQNPQAVRIEAGHESRELKAAITQALAPGLLRLNALFLDAPLTVQDVERALAAKEPLQGTTLVTELEVTP